MKYKILKTLILGISFIFLIKLALAYNGYGYGGGFSWYDLRPSTLLQNEWVVFGGVFVLTFAIVYLALSQVFGREPKTHPVFPWITEESKTLKGPVAVISLIVALFVAAAASQRAFLYGYLGEELGKWILFVVSLVLIALIVKIAYGWGKIMGVGVAAIIIWILLNSIDLYYVLPGTISYQLEGLYSILTSSLIPILIIGGGIVYLIYKSQKPRRAKHYEAPQVKKGE